mmetsp:Transcript_13001/g.21670  ORF Transcript_13001/g.21670 Transcript_13001/m.21670 type:complete len:90 (+) Transcript_13001:580-849(+)
MPPPIPGEEPPIDIIDPPLDPAPAQVGELLEDDLEDAIMKAEDPGEIRGFSPPPGPPREESEGAAAEDAAVADPLAAALGNEEDRDERI